MSLWPILAWRKSGCRRRSLRPLTLSWGRACSTSENTSEKQSDVDMTSVSVTERSNDLRFEWNVFDGMQGVCFVGLLGVCLCLLFLSLCPFPLTVCFTLKFCCCRLFFSASFSLFVLRFQFIVTTLKQFTVKNICLAGKSKDRRGERFTRPFSHNIT